jgi:hypothetical protein
MTGEEVIAMGDRHGPFTTKAEAEEDLLCSALTPRSSRADR